jgi:hypothetical protein
MEEAAATACQTARKEIWYNRRMSMEPKPDPFVYHGSNVEFDSDHAKPKRNRRGRRMEDGKMEITFDENSFHATPHKWIALAYTYNPNQPHEIDGKTAYYNMAVSLYENTQVVEIRGFGSLEESLEKLYGGGGYLYHFDKDKFFYQEGLGNLEVIVKDPIKPITVERVSNPIEEMKKLGVKFEFMDVGLPENEKRRTYA